MLPSDNLLRIGFLGTIMTILPFLSRFPLPILPKYPTTSRLTLTYAPHLFVVRAAAIEIAFGQAYRQHSQAFT